MQLAAGFGGDDCTAAGGGRAGTGWDAGLAIDAGGAAGDHADADAETSGRGADTAGAAVATTEGAGLAATGSTGAGAAAPALRRTIAPVTASAASPTAIATPATAMRPVFLSAVVCHVAAVWGARDIETGAGADGGAT